MVKGFRFTESELGVFKTSETQPIIDILATNNRLIGLTMGNFSLIDLIHSILQFTGKAHVVVATWSAGIKDAHQVKWMIDSDLLYSFKLLTDHSYKTRQSKYALSIENLFGVENIRTSEMHAKFTLIHNDNYKIAIRTSMNLNANKTCETFEIDNDKSIFDFYMNFVDHTFGSTPSGFTEDSTIVNKELSKFFNQNQPEKTKLWTDI